MNRREMLVAMSAAAALAAGTPAFAASKPTRASTVTRQQRKAWAKEHFRGFENILSPSFTPDLKQLDEAGIRLDVRKSIEHGFFSTLCSLPALSNQEVKRFLEIAVDEARGKISVATAIHHADEAHMMEVMRIAEQAGVEHFLLDFPRAGTQDELYRHVAKFSEATNMGVYLWLSNQHGFDRFHPSGIPIELFDRVADLANVIALKVASIDAAVFYELLERYNDRMLIGTPLISILPMAVRSYGMQWSGAWTVEAVQSPEKRYATDFFNLLLAGKSAPAMKIYWSHLAPGFALMRQQLGAHAKGGAHPWEHFKAYQFAVGGNGGLMRPDPEHPEVAAVTPQDLEAIKAALNKIAVPVADAPFDAFKVGRANWQKDKRS